jgi:hypothetical protein
MAESKNETGATADDLAAEAPIPIIRAVDPSTGKPTTHVINTENPTEEDYRLAEMYLRQPYHLGGYKIKKSFRMTGEEPTSAHIKARLGGGGITKIPVSGEMAKQIKRRVVASFRPPDTPSPVVHRPTPHPALAAPPKRPLRLPKQPASATVTHQTHVPRPPVTANRKAKSMYSQRPAWKPVSSSEPKILQFAEFTENGDLYRVYKRSDRTYETSKRKGGEGAGLNEPGIPEGFDPNDHTWHDAKELLKKDRSSSWKKKKKRCKNLRGAPKRSRSIPRKFSRTRGP